jgi:beta-galactosidase
VTGPYTFLRSLRPNGNMSRDMTLFEDEDGAVYHVFASNENRDLRICRLSEDCLSHTGLDVVAHSDTREAPAVFKYDGTYYLMTSGCTGWTPNAARVDTAESMLGPWRTGANPAVGPQAETTYDSQSTFVLPVPGREGAFIFMADRWNPRNLRDSRYVWLPIRFADDGIVIEWIDEWDLGWFGAQTDGRASDPLDEAPGSTIGGAGGT